MRSRVFNIIDNGHLKVRVLPNSRRNELKEIREDVLVVAIKAPPEHDKANKELIQFLRKELKISFVIKSGKTSKNKKLLVV